MGERFSEPVFDEGIAEQATRDRIRTEYDVLASRAEQERREAEADPWIRTGDKNIVKADFFPSSSHPTPRHPGDDELYR